MSTVIISVILTVKAAICWTLLSKLRIIRVGESRQSVWRGDPFAAVIGSWREQFWRLGLERLILAIALLAVLVAVACYVIWKIRPKSVQKELSTSQWLSKYGELHSRGELTDEEYRTIKTKLAEQLQDELNNSGKDG
jgi:uncharacterized membrane protein